MMCTTSIYLVAHRDSNKRKKAAISSTISTPKLWMLADRNELHTSTHNTYATQQWDIRTLNVKLSKSSFITIFIVTQNSYNISMVFVRLATWLTLFLFLCSSDLYLFLFLCLALFCPFECSQTLSTQLKPTNFGGAKEKKIVLILCEWVLYMPRWARSRRNVSEKNHFYRVCWCQIN